MFERWSQPSRWSRGLSSSSEEGSRTVSAFYQREKQKGPGRLISHFRGHACGDRLTGVAARICMLKPMWWSRPSGTREGKNGGRTDRIERPGSLPAPFFSKSKKYCRGRKVKSLISLKPACSASLITCERGTSCSGLCGCWGLSGG